MDREADVEVSVMDAAGRRVRQLASARFGAGERTFIWDLADDAGRPVASGLYFARAKAGGARTGVRVAVIR
jgi:flagellar hook assembly protein FlgD